MWKQWINTVLGILVIAIPFTAIAGATLVWTMVVVGVVVAVLSLWSALEGSSEGATSRTMRHA